MDVHEIEAWFAGHFGKGVAAVRADLEDARNRVQAVEQWAAAHAAQADAVLAAIEKLAATVDPAVAPEVTAAVDAAKAAAAEAKRLLDNVLAKM